MKWCLNVSPKYLTPSAIFRYSRSRSPFYISQLGSHQNLPHSHSSLTLLTFSNNTHSRGILCTTRSSSLQFNDKLRYHFVDVGVFSLCGPYVRGYSRRWTRTHKNFNDSFSSLGSSLTKGSRKMMITRIVSMDIPFPSQTTQMTSADCKLTRMLLKLIENGLWQSLTATQDNTGQVAEMTEGWLPVTQHSLQERPAAPCSF